MRSDLSDRVMSCAHRGYSSPQVRFEAPRAQMRAHASPTRSTTHCLSGRARSRRCDVRRVRKRQARRQQSSPPWRAIEADRGQTFGAAGTAQGAFTGSLRNVWRAGRCSWQAMQVRQQRLAGHARSSERRGPVRRSGLQVQSPDRSPAVVCRRRTSGPDHRTRGRISHISRTCFCSPHSGSLRCRAIAAQTPRCRYLPIV